MPLDFPASPVLDELYTFGGRTWKYNGSAWDLQPQALTTINATDDTTTTTLYPVMVGQTGINTTAKARSTATAFSFNASTGAIASGGNMTAWNTTTPGLGVGGLHLGAASATSNAGSSITFGARDASSGSNAQAGIYINSDGLYGTRMYFATTDAYVSGSKVAMSIDHLGAVTISRSSLTAPVLRVATSTPGNFGSIAATWSGSAIYPTLYSDSADRWVMHINPHISYVSNGTNGYTGSMTGATIRMASNTSATTYWDMGVGTNSIGTDRFSIGRAGTSLIDITNVGNLTIGGGTAAGATATPAKIETGNSYSNASTRDKCKIYLYNSGTEQYGFSVGSVGDIQYHSNTTHDFYIANTKQLAVSSTGIVVTGTVTASSDIKLKENIEVINNALEKVSQIRGVTFTRNDLDDKEQRHAGVIAQEIEQVLPEVVMESADGIKSVAYGNLVGLLIEAIKEQQTQINNLNIELNILKSTK